MPGPKINIVSAQSFFQRADIPEFPAYSPDTATPKETQELVRKIRSGEINCPKPTMISIGDLLAQLPNKPDAKPGVGLYLLQGCDARVIPAYSSMNGSVRQIASQFNNGESQSRKPTQPDQFKHDRTQGPAEQRTSGGAAIARYAHSSSCDGFAVILADPELNAEFENLFDYQHGFLTPNAGKEEEGVAFLKQHINKLVLNVERVAIDGAPGQSAIQVLNAAPAFGGAELFSRAPEARPHLVEMSKVLLDAQYQAVSAVAILEARQNPDKRIPVSFTMVGGGAFGNDKATIAKSLSQAIKSIKESGVNNIDICLSIYRPEEIAEYKNLTEKGEEFADLSELLNKTPITQSDLQKKETTVRAMEAAINALSTKSHLLEGHQDKSSRLEKLKSAYEKSISPEGADRYLLQFSVEASKPRESKWGVFTSDFGETASAKAFFGQVPNGEDLKQRAKIDHGSGNANTSKQADFKAQMNAVRGGQENPQKNPEDTQENSMGLSK